MLEIEAEIVTQLSLVLCALYLYLYHPKLYSNISDLHKMRSRLKAKHI